MGRDQGRLASHHGLIMTTSVYMKRVNGQPTGEFVISSNSNDELKGARIEFDDADAYRRIYEVSTPGNRFVQASMTLDFEGIKQVLGQAGHAIQEYEANNDPNVGG